MTDATDAPNATDREEPEQKKYDPWQHAMLAYCSYKGDLFLWNDWRKHNNAIEIFLEGADLSEAHLHGANLRSAYLVGVMLDGAHLEGAYLNGAHLEGVEMFITHLEGANLHHAHLEGALLYLVHLKSTQLILVQVDAKTTISSCHFDKKTNFTGVGLDAATIDPELKAAFKNNIRRIRWQKWAEDTPTNWKRRYRKGVNLFWKLSDYGSSTERILGWFFGLAIGFGLLYWLFAVIPGSESIVHELRQAGGNEQAFGVWHTLARSLYFSVVTMTTLGFGDMHATSTGGWPSYMGYLFLSIQVMMGYVLLGALVTRLGILFTSEAPAATPHPDYVFWRKAERGQDNP